MTIRLPAGTEIVGDISPTAPLTSAEPPTKRATKCPPRMQNATFTMRITRPVHLVFHNLILLIALCGGTLLVAQLVDVMRYKPEGRGFESRWCH
jgi:hypothetical protein